MSDEIESEPLEAATVFGDSIGRAREYVVRLAGDGILRGLIGPREAGRIWSRHVLNSAVASPLPGDGATVVDVGSGAGLPGIPMALRRPDCSFVLLEPIERRAIFLSEIIEELQLTHCRVVRGRAEEVVKKWGSADVVTSRAVAPLARVALWSAPLLKPGGKMLALKGLSADEELVRDSAVLSKAGLVDLEVVRLGVGILADPTFAVVGTKAGLKKGKRSAAGSANRR